MLGFQSDWKADVQFRIRRASDFCGAGLICMPTFFKPKGLKALFARVYIARILGLILIIGILIGINPVAASTLKSVEIQDYASLCTARPPVIPRSELSWLAIPDSVEELNTRIPFVTLAGVLIDRGVVNAQSCPDGGLLFNGAANSCGLDRALDLVYSMQNLYDDEIINAWELTGVPPAMLKLIFRYESQFWPGRFDNIHFGLGHMTSFGASTTLFWSPDVYQDACYSTYGQACTDPYFPSPNPGLESIVITLLDYVNAECPQCQMGIDVAKAEASVLVFAKMAKSYCRQTEQIIYNLTNKNPGNTTNYVDLWKLSLFDYNSGAGCLYVAASAALNSGLRTLTWDNIQPFIPEYCQGGVDYVERITAPFYDFSQ
jgi:hypothetical protein